MFVLLRGILKALFAHGWFRNEFFYRSAKCMSPATVRSGAASRLYMIFLCPKKSRWYKFALIWNVSKNRCKYYPIFAERVTSLHFRWNKFHNSFPRKKEQNLDYDTWLDSTLTSAAQPTQSAFNVKKGMPLCPMTCRDWLDHTVNILVPLRLALFLSTKYHC